MLIYGNTPRDIMAMIWRRRYKYVAIFAVMVIAVMLVGCGTAKKKYDLKGIGPVLGHPGIRKEFNRS